MLRLIFFGYNCKTQILTNILCLAYTEIFVNHYIYADERGIWELFNSYFYFCFLIVSFCILF